MCLRRYRGLLALLGLGPLFVLLAAGQTAAGFPRAVAAGAPLVAVPGAGAGGLQGGWALNDAGELGFPHSVLGQLPLIQEAGAGWLRINFRLGAAYAYWTERGTNGATALERYDALVDEARARGLQVLGLLSNESWPGQQADWTAGSAERGLGTGDNAYLQAFSQRAAVVLARHFQGRIDTWEVWNEPNAWTANPSPGVYDGSTYIYPSNFAWLLRHVYEDTRAAGLTGLTLVSGGLFGHDQGGVDTALASSRVLKRGNGPRTETLSAAALAGALSPAAMAGLVSGAEYLTATYQRGRSHAGWDAVRQALGSYPLDAVGQHLYVDQGGRTSPSKLRASLDDLRGAYTSIEGAFTGKQTVVTEFGWSTDFVSASVQAENLRTAYAAFKDTPYVTNAYWFSVQDVPEASLSYGLQSGGDEQDSYHGIPKPALQAYQTAVAPATPTPTATPTATPTPTRTATPDPAGLVLAGRLALQRAPTPPATPYVTDITVRLYQPFAVPGTTRTPVGTAQARTDQSGAFRVVFIGLSGGSYAVNIKPAHALSVEQTVALPNAGQVSFATPLEGDANGDDAIGISDFSLFSAAFNRRRGEAGFDPGVDFDQDGAVTILDFSLLLANFNQRGPARQGVRSG